MRQPAEVLAELERELDELERRCAELREAADHEAQQAADWEGRAMTSIRDGREDLARQAVQQQENYAAAAAELESEVVELEAVRDAYRNAVGAVRATLGASAGGRG